MRTKFLAAGAAAVLALTAVSANAATYVSYFDTKGGVTLAGAVTDLNAYGKVTIIESTDLLSFKVELLNGQVAFLNTGNGQNDETPGNKQPFSFNLNGAYTVTPSNAHDPLPGDGHNQSFYYGGHNVSPGWEQQGYGFFKDFIGCCNSPTDIQNGSNVASPAPLYFTVGATGININSISSNAGGWWFAADVTTSFNGGDTFTIGAQDINCIAGCGPAVPEPATWGLMILGFFGAGSMIRRRHTLAA